MVADNDFAERLVDIVPRLESMACFITGSKEAARDLVQDACERAWARREQWSGESFDQWMFTILRTRWQDYLRRHAPGESLIARGVGGETVSDQWAAAQIEAVLQRPDLEKVWGTLSEHQREVIGMVHILGYTYAETARILDVPIGTVMSRLHRAHRAAARNWPDSVSS